MRSNLQGFKRKGGKFKYHTLLCLHNQKIEVCVLEIPFTRNDTLRLSGSIAVMFSLYCAELNLVFARGCKHALIPCNTVRNFLPRYGKRTETAFSHKQVSEEPCHRQTFPCRHEFLFHTNLKSSRLRSSSETYDAWRHLMCLFDRRVRIFIFSTLMTCGSDLNSKGKRL